MGTSGPIMVGVSRRGVCCTQIVRAYILMIRVQTKRCPCASRLSDRVNSREQTTTVSALHSSCDTFAQHRVRLSRKCDLEMRLGGSARKHAESREIIKPTVRTFPYML